MAQRSKKDEINNDHEAIATEERDRSQRTRMKGAVIHRRMTDKPDPFIPKLAVKPGVSLVDLLRSDEAVSGRGAEK